MTNTRAVVEAGIVVDLIVADDEFELTGKLLVDGAGARIGWTYADGVFAPPAVALAELKAERAAAVMEVRDRKLTGGFTVPESASESLGGKVLQTRNEIDRSAWLTSQAAYQAAVIAGEGAAMNARFRPADNTNVTVSCQEGLDVLLAMAAWGAEIFARSWALKDAIAAAADEAVLAAIDIDAGWPA